MDKHQSVMLDSPLGKKETDSAGSPLGVVRMDPNSAYAGVGPLLQRYINDSDQQAWDAIRKRTDYIHARLDDALVPLDRETGFMQEIRTRLAMGRKLVFKPNLVSILNIDPQTHGVAIGRTACTDWCFFAALMRWFHDRLNISYYQMAVGEAATVMSSAAGQYTLLKSEIDPEGLPVTPEAGIEGRSEDFYAGWGFYFARKYLAESLAPGDHDDPMNGFEESVKGVYIPPGLAVDKLMVYDLNRIYDDTTKGREVEVPDGVNFRSITLHKVIVGGNPADPEDMKAYPGCVLINVPKLKVHSRTLFTNAVKNLGIGLYPMQSSREGGFKWDYALPHNPVPGIKFIPHQVWHPEMDYTAGAPKRDENGDYRVRKTGGIQATMADVIKAVSNQNIFMFHVVDSIEATNLEHATTGLGKLEPEGLVFAGTDPVALDLLCARYIFKNAPLDAALTIDLDDGAGGKFIQQIPLPVIENGQITTQTGYDCPLARDISFEYAENRGLGRKQYYVVGRDAVMDRPMVSLQGHLGRVENGAFSELVTEILYFDALKLPWDLQKTTISYLEAVDRLAGSNLKARHFDPLDENGDGVLHYEEAGKRGSSGAVLAQIGMGYSIIGSRKLGFLSGPFAIGANRLKWSRPEWNAEGHDIFRDVVFSGICWTAFRMSQSGAESPDLFLPGLVWGKGKWPSYETARRMFLGSALYGGRYPNTVMFPGLYSMAFRYADMTQNQGRYTGSMINRPDPESLGRYFSDAGEARDAPLDFIFYVPEGFDTLNGWKLPNTAITSDPGLVFTAHFSGGGEVWPAVIPGAVQQAKAS